MLHIHMCHLVSHYAGQLSFVFGGVDGADVHKHLPTWQRESIDIGLRNDMELKRPGILLWNRCHKLLAEMPNVLRFRAAVGQDGHLLIDLRCDLSPESALILLRHGSLAGIRKCGTGRLLPGLGLSRLRKSCIRDGVTPYESDDRSHHQHAPKVCT